MRFPYLCLDPALLTCNDKRLRVHVTESCCDTSGCRRARKKSANSAAIQIDHSEPTSRFPNSRVLKFPNIFWCVRETSKKTWVYIYTLHMHIHTPRLFPNIIPKTCPKWSQVCIFLGFFSWGFLRFPMISDRCSKIQRKTKQHPRTNKEKPKKTNNTLYCS